MKSKGFTLIEIIVTVILIALVALMFTNSFEAINRNNREKEYFRLVSKLETAITVYAENNEKINSQLYGSKGYVVVTVRDLISQGYISRDLYDPTTENAIDATREVYAILDEYGSISVEYPYDKSSSNACYLETTPLVVSKSTSIATISFSNLNKVGLQIINVSDNSRAHSLTKDSNIKVFSHNIKTNTAGTYTIYYRYKDCNKDREGNDIWRLATRKVTLY